MNKRIDWIDTLKGIGIYFVILGHMLETQNEFRSWIYSFHMPLFLLVSGLTFNIEKTYNTSVKDYLAKRFKHLIIPYLWLEFISLTVRYFTMPIYLNGRIPIGEFLRGIFISNESIAKAPSNECYFIILLFFAEMALFIITKLARKNKLIMLAATLILLPISLFLKQPCIWHLNIVPVAMLFVLTGALLFDLYKRFEDKLNSIKLYILLPACAVLELAAIGLWRINGKISIHANAYGKSFFLAFPCAVLTACVLAFISMKISKIRFIKFAGMYTLFYLALHKPVLSIISGIFPNLTQNALYIIIVSLVVYFVFMPLIIVIKRYAPFVLGRNAEPDSRSQLIGGFVCFAVALCGACTPFIDGLFKLSKVKTTPFQYVVLTVFFLALCGVFMYGLRTVLPGLFGLKCNKATKWKFID